MICGHVFDSIGIHANGDIVCWDVDVRGQHVYGNVFRDRIADVFNGPAYREIREWFLKSSPDTWCPAVNHHCPLRTVQAKGAERIGECRIKTIRLEPVTYCNLECPVCPVEDIFKRDPIVRETRGSKLLPLETMLDVVAQLPDLELMEYYGYGEPFLHKDSIRFLREVRRTRPDVVIVTNTNGTVLTPGQIEAIATESLLHRAVFSIDGATAESYRKYRVGGTFSKAFGKMKALAEACRVAGTWKKYVTSPNGQVQITWQYILFEWNDSDEELALARELAQKVGVPIEWVITSGYGASKRFLHGSADAKRLMEPPTSVIHMAANAEIDNRIHQRGLESFRTYANIDARCELLSPPHNETASYKAHFYTDRSSITFPPGVLVTFTVAVENKTDREWDQTGSNYLRFGVKIKPAGGKKWRELPGVILPAAAVQAHGHDTVTLAVDLPSQTGEYEVFIDLVQEWVYWFSDCGSSLPLNLTVYIVNTAAGNPLSLWIFRKFRSIKASVPRWVFHMKKRNQPAHAD
jgi:hypothetical protein